MQLEQIARTPASHTSNPFGVEYYPVLGMKHAEHKKLDSPDFCYGPGKTEASQ